MNSILQLFIRHGGLLTLLVVEVFCFYLISSYNSEQGEIASASWARYSGAVLNWKAGWEDYFYLRDENTRLRLENAKLQTELANTRLIEVPYRDTFLRKGQIDTLENKIIRPRYVLISARVVSNTISNRNNWMIINRGSEDGVQANTGVISRNGVVGVVRYVSDHYAVVMSVLHGQTKVSAALKKHEYFGPLIWDGENPEYMTLTDIPNHLQIQPGDSVQTSNYTLLFPEGHPIGWVDKAEPVQGSNFFKIQVRLSQNPANVRDVYVVTNRYAEQLDQLQQAVKDE
ncbi:MAG: rod shape-determining protein MreC [Bacteroidetes bacterium]|nr:MAG: rod shape-determining protein MreC [Bacteroidota bacterium]